jgi:hypothetical protein
MNKSIHPKQKEQILSEYILAVRLGAFIKAMWIRAANREWISEQEFCEYESNYYKMIGGLS